MNLDLLPVCLLMGECWVKFKQIVLLQNERDIHKDREWIMQRSLVAEKLILLISEFTFWMISIMNKSNIKLLILRYFVYKVIELVGWLSNSSAAVWIFIIFFIT